MEMEMEMRPGGVGDGDEAGGLVVEWSGGLEWRFGGRGVGWRFGGLEWTGGSEGKGWGFRSTVRYG